MRSLDCAVKFWFVSRYETVVISKHVLALLLVDLLRNFQTYLVHLSLICSKNTRRFSFFKKFRRFTYMLLLFPIVIPSFPTRISDMRSRFCSSVTLGKKDGVRAKVEWCVVDFSSDIVLAQSSLGRFLNIISNWAVFVEI